MKPTNARGFTLLELLIALALLALLTILLLGALHSATLVWEKSTARMDASDDFRLVREWLARQIRQARPLLIKATATEYMPAFYGSRDHMSFIVASPAHYGWGGLHRLTIFVRRSGNGANLLLDDALLTPGSGGQTVAQDTAPRVLLKNLADVRFAYFGRRNPHAPLEWHDSWRGIVFPPRLIRLTLNSSDGRSAGVPPLIVALPAGGGLRPTAE